MYLTQMQCKRLHMRNIVFNSKKGTSERKRSYFCTQIEEMTAKCRSYLINNRDQTTDRMLYLTSK